MNFAKFLRTPFLQNPYGRLLLKIYAFAHWFWEKRHLRNKDFDKQAFYMKPWYIGYRGGYRDFKRGRGGLGGGGGGVLYFCHHGCPTKKNLGFKWSIKAKITLKPQSFWRSFLPVFSNLINLNWSNHKLIQAVDEILSIFQILKTLS